MSEPEARLRARLGGFERLAVAVSGGVDSTTLAALAHRVSGGRALLVHAVSPAVPAEATERLRARGAREGWNLRLIDAGELADPRYRANPVDRCFYCKWNLYAAIARLHDGPVASGTNLDDLADFRPGLEAARRAGVVHPFVEAGMGKAAVRALARALGLVEFADLPASPCLASRLETGLEVTAERLSLVGAVERRVRAFLGLTDLRCRLRAHGVELEVESSWLEGASPTARAQLVQEVEAELAARGIRAPVSLGPYRRGSAFLRPVGP